MICALRKRFAKMLQPGREPSWNHQERPTPAFVMENFESRCLLSAEVTYWSGVESSIGSDYSLSAEVQVGDNGEGWGLPAMYSGSSDWDGAYGFAAWDADTSNGFDSGWQDFSVNVALDSSITMQVGEFDEAEAYTSVQSIEQIIVRASVADADMRMSWGDLVIHLYSSGELVTSVSMDDVIADSFGQPQLTGEAAGAQINLAGYTFDQIVISGQVRLQASAPYTPGPDYISGQIYFV